MFLELFISLGKWLCFIFLPSFQWQNRSWQRNRTERQHRNLNHLLNYHFHSSFSANLEICNGGGIELLQHTLPRRQKQQAVKDCVPEQLSSSPGGLQVHRGHPTSLAGSSLELKALQRCKEQTAPGGAARHPQLSQGSPSSQGQEGNTCQSTATVQIPWNPQVWAPAQLETMRGGWWRQCTHKESISCLPASLSTLSPYGEPQPLPWV